MRLLKLVDDPNRGLRRKVEHALRHVASLSQLASGCRAETFDSLQERAINGGIHLREPEAELTGNGTVIYRNHVSAMIHWHLPERGAIDWMQVCDACLTYTLLHGTVRAYHLDGMMDLYPGQSIRLPAGIKFRFEWDDETYCQVFYQRRSACLENAACSGQCSVIRTGPDVVYGRGR